MSDREEIDSILTQSWLEHSALTLTRPPSPGSSRRLAAALAAAGPEQASLALDHWLGEMSRATNRVSVLATGLGWVGGGIRSVEQSLLALIGEAREEILVTAYALTGGSSRVLERLAAAATTGVRCVLVVNRLVDQPTDMRAFLENLVLRSPATVTVYDFAGSGAEGLHAKVLVIDRRAAIVGSANLSFRGMTASHELGVLVRGPGAGSVAEAIDSLTQSHWVRRAFSSYDQ